jgi:hypothetical protein
LQENGAVAAGIHGQPIGLGAALLHSALKWFPRELAHFTIWHMVLPSGYPDYVIYSLIGGGFIFPEKRVMVKPGLNFDDQLIIWPR